MKLRTLQQAADELNLSYNTVRQYVHYGVLESKKVGKNKMIEQSEIDRYKKKRLEFGESRRGAA